MKKYFELKDDSSSKFWEIVIVDNEYTLRYGKVGSKGTQKTKVFDSPEEATKEGDKLIKTKVKKGYKEELTSYSHLLECTDKKKLHIALCDHFDYLVDFPGYDQVLKKVMKDAHNVEMDGDDLVVQFRGDKVLYASAPADLSKYKGYPTSYKKCAIVHEYITFPENGWALGFGNNDTFEGEYLENVNSEMLSVIKAEDAICAISDYSDWWIYNPTQKNVLGEAGLSFLSHNGGDVGPAEMIPIGSLMLRRMAEVQDITMEFPEPSAGDQDPMKWWESLSDNWKKALYDSADIYEDKTMDHKLIKNILKLSKFRFHEDSCDLETLEPLVMLKKLDEISMSRQPTITTLEPISSIGKMYYISITGSPIKDLSPLSGMKRLQFLELENTEIEDLSPLTKLLKLERVTVKGSNVTDLKPLAKLKKLRDLNLSGSTISSLESLPHLESLSGFDISSTTITDISPLKQYERLGSVNFSNTEITDLSPLDAVSDIFTFSCKQSAITFKELLRFLSFRYDKVISKRLPLTVYTDSMTRPQIFSEELGLLDKLPEGSEDVTSFYVFNFVLHFYKSKKNAEAIELLKAFVKLQPTEIGRKAVQELVSNSIPVLMESNEPKLEDELFTLLPEQLTLSRLVFNLCCMYAKRGDKENVLKYMKDALGLSHDPQVFKTDSDLAAYQDDPDFIKILAGPKSVDPSINPAGWWNPLDGDWKTLIYDAVEDGIGSKEDIAKVKLIEELRVWEPKTLEPLRYLTGLKKLKIEHSFTTDLEPLTGLTNLEELSLIRSTIDQKSFKEISPLAGLTNLKKINIEEQDVSDLSALENMDKLKSIRLVRLPADSIEALRGTKNLERVEIQIMKVTDIEPLKDNHKMGMLSLYSTDVSDISIVENMTELGSLTLSGSKVSDIAVLSKCKELVDVQLGSCPVTTLKSLEDLPDLVEISVYDTKISKDEIEAFKERHPKCEVE